LLARRDGQLCHCTLNHLKGARNWTNDLMDPGNDGWILRAGIGAVSELIIRSGISSDLPAIASLLVHSWQGLYRDIVPAAVLDAMSVDQQLKRHVRIMAQGTAYIVAENAAGLVGFTSHGRTRFASIPTEAELYTLYVDPLHLRQGIGRRLLHAVLADAHTPWKDLGVLVMKKNPFRAFYDQHGFQVIGEEGMDLGGCQVTNVFYRRERRTAT
jgi:GNAT superfamily N-acetyltransferase